MASINDVLKAAIERLDCPVQLVHECILKARLSARGRPPHTQITLATRYMTPADLMYHTAGIGAGQSGKPKHVGIIVWVPFEEYERIVSQ